MSAATAILPISPLTLSAPSRKLFIDQLGKARNANGKRTCDLYGKEIEINVVWLQGHVKKIDLHEDYLILDDGTGEVKIEHISKVPGGCQVTDVGTYAMVIGDVAGSKANSSLRIRALKVQDLSDGANASYWKLEVLDAQLNT